MTCNVIHVYNSEITTTVLHQPPFVSILANKSVYVLKIIIINMRKSKNLGPYVFKFSSVFIFKENGNQVYLVCVFLFSFSRKLSSKNGKSKNNSLVFSKFS